MSDCEFNHPHPEHPCGRRVIPGLTRCSCCGLLDGDPLCHCWTPATPAHLDALYAEAWGVADPHLRPSPVKPTSPVPPPWFLLAALVVVLIVAGVLW